MAERGRYSDVSAFSDSVLFFINGEQVTLRSGDVPPSLTLLEYLRQRRLTGTKLGCGMGGCGACTVAVSTWDHEAGKETYRSVNSCLTPVLAMNGMHVTTIEGLGDTERPHALQAAFARHHASQCGFCTPGFIMSLYSTLQANDGQPTLKQLEGAFDGNLCRCTGYRPILDAAKSVAACDFGACQDHGANVVPVVPKDLGGGSSLITTNSFAKREETGVQGLLEEQRKEKQLALAFPELLVHRQLLPAHLSHRACPWEWYAPTSLFSLVELAARLPRGSRFYSGNTDFTEQIRHAEGLEAMVSLLGVPELRGVCVDERGGSDGGPVVSVGLAEPLTNVRAALEKLAGDGRWRGLSEVERAIGAFGSSQIRNWCGLGSLLLRSELVPILAAGCAEVVVECLADPSGEAAIAQLHQQKQVQHKPLGSEDSVHGTVTQESQRFFSQRLSGSKAASSLLGGPSMALAKRRAPLLGLQLSHGEVATRLLLPALGSHEIFRGYRGSLRRDGAFSVAAAGFRVALQGGEGGSQRVAEASVVASGFGGDRCSAAFPAVAAALKGKPWPLAAAERESTLSALIKEAESLETSTQVPKGHYRKALVASFLQSFLSGEASDSVGVPRPLSSGVQQYELKRFGGLHACPDHKPLSPDQPRAPVGEPLPHTTVMEQATGEAVYVDDLPIPGDCLWAASVASKVPKGKIRGVDFSEAVRLPGVFGYFDYRDFVTRVEEKKIPANNAYKVFTSGMATAVGHCIGITVAETQELAKKAARLVSVDMEELDPVFTVEEALERKTLIPYDHVIEQGAARAALDECKAAGRYVEGELELGGQEHFYLEPHAIMAVPGEGGEMVIYSCTQCIHKTQKTVAEVLGVPSSKVTVKVKRMGGAFGGKEVLSTFVAARLAVAARRLRRPVRTLFDRVEDMEVSGQREPMFCKFECGFSPEGKILGYSVDLYANSGHTTSITKDVMNRAISHAHNAYHIPNFRAKGVCCDTNWYSFTAFRGFGAPQAMLALEMALEMVAAKVKLPVEAVRVANLLPDGASTPYGQLVEGNVLRPMWDELWRSAEVEARQKAVDEFNRSAPPYRRRGLCMVPTKYGVNFPVKFLNASGAFVCVYQQDATVLVCHGGTEMGQGLNIKLAQIAANALGCDISMVHVGESASDKVPNAPPTAASVGSDVNGMAVLDACEKIARRVQPYRPGPREDPSTWKQAVQKAYLDRVSLSAEGYYATPDCCAYDWGMDTKDNSKRGIMYAYHTFGVCCAEVEVDFHTGEWACLRADVLMDVGSTINPAIDIGQVEGAFVQGMGYYTSEELHWAGRDVPWAKPGTLVTNSPHSYKIPAASDVPCDFRVALWPGLENKRAVHSSKAVGEPPTFLSAAVFLAIKRAICAFNGVDYLPLDSPATTERIRMACNDFVTKEISKIVGPYRAPKLC